MAPASASAPPATHSASIGRGSGTSCATITGTKKMPPPMTFEITIAAASNAPSLRLRYAADGTATLLREELARQVELGDLHPLRRAVLGEDVHPHVAELRVLEHVGARLRRIAGVAGLRADGQQARLVAVERHALLEDLVEILFRRLPRRDRGAGRRQLLEDHVHRQRPQTVVGGLL